MSTLGSNDPTILEDVESYCDNDWSGFGEVMTLFSNDSTILEEVSLIYFELGYWLVCINCRMLHELHLYVLEYE